MHNGFAEKINEYGLFLSNEERCIATIEKYLHDLREFSQWLGENALTKDRVAEWKTVLSEKGYSPGSVNGKLSAVNGFLKFFGREDCRVRLLRIQRRLFRDPSRELTQEEYQRLVSSAYDEGKIRLALLMETICCIGLRVSEVKYITVEAARRGRTDIMLKGKVRTILFPQKLCKKLIKYAKKEKIQSGSLFLTRFGKPLGRIQIWSEMKALCNRAGISPTKVFPHNLRHLFARTFYRACRDIVRLADVLGHSSIETTRIYLIGTGEEHIKQMERLCLIR